MAFSLPKTWSEVTPETITGKDLNDNFNAVAAEFDAATATVRVANIAALKALAGAPASKTVFVQGYYTAGDGGSGTFYADTNDTTTVDNGGTVIVGNDGTRWKRIYNGPVMLPWFGAKTDGTDISAAMTAMLAVGNRWHIPAGEYTLTSPVLLTTGNATGWGTLTGDGRHTIIHVHMNDYALQQDNAADYIYSAIIQGITFESDPATYAAGGIRINGTLRGLVMRDLWFSQVKLPIYFGSLTDATVSLEDIHAYMLTTQVAGAFGIEGNTANTIFGRNVEIVGGWEWCIKLASCGVVNLSAINPSGSSVNDGALGGILLDTCRQVTIDTVWIEQLDQTIPGVGEGPAIKLVNTDTARLLNINAANGSIFLDNSTATVETVAFDNFNGGFRLTNDAVLRTKDINGNQTGTTGLVQPDFAEGDWLHMDAMAQGGRALNAHTVVTNASVDSDVIETRLDQVTLSKDTTLFYSGDASINVTTTGTFQGAKFNETVIANQSYTLMVRALIPSGQSVDYIILSAGANTAFARQPSRLKMATTDQWMVLFATAVSTTTTLSVELKFGNSFGNFRIDSYALLQGVKFATPETCRGSSE